MNPSIRVAFATNNKSDLNEHFGSAKFFSIYDISKNNFTLVDNLAIVSKDTDKTISLLEGVHIVYFLNIGPTAAAKIINKGIFPIKYKEDVAIKEELEKLIKMLNTNPPPFIKKIFETKVA
jgi:nitrogen fixation protein NifX